ncbi:MAG TPA: glycosyltransferase family 87 protein [Vicinamibacterales bacterium]|nr:glycosyltransferase family 87 protein [Vicinamibacterales bacterium]
MKAALRGLVWPVVLIAIAAAIYLRVGRQMTDFAVYRTAATRALAAEPLYRESDGHYQFKYLPAFAFAMAPFAWMEPEGAKMIWFALSVGLLTAYVRWSLRALPERRRSDRVLMWLTIVLMAKFYLHELTLGQTNILLGTLLVAALLAVQIDHPLVAAGLISTAAFVKPYALVIMPWLAFTYGLETVGVSVAVLGVGLLAPALVYGWRGNLDLLAGWYQTITTSTAPNLLGADNVSLAAMWAKWLGPGTAASGLATASSVALLGLVAAVWRRRLSVQIPDYLEYALLMLLVPLLSPQGWDYVLLLATPAVICLMDRWGDVTSGWRIFTGAALALMGLTIFDVMGRDLYGRFMALSIVTVAAMATAGSLAHLRWRALA